MTVELSAPVLRGTTTFDQTANSAASTVVPADLNVGTPVLLSDVITAIAAIQSQVNTLTHVQNSTIDVLQAQRLAL